MQLEALGTDALMIMGTPVNNTERINGDSTLQTIIEESDSTIKNEMFRENFLELVNANTTGPQNDIQFNASYSCRDNLNKIQTIPFSQSNHTLTGGEHTVRATKWIIVNKPVPCGSGTIQNRAMLVEVLLWRD
jgi:hypothetical protein